MGRVLDLGHHGYAVRRLSDRPNEAKAGWRMRWVDGTRQPAGVPLLPSRLPATQAECSLRRVTQCMLGYDVSRSAKSLRRGTRATSMRPSPRGEQLETCRIHLARYLITAEGLTTRPQAKVWVF